MTTRITAMMGAAIVLMGTLSALAADRPATAPAWPGMIAGDMTLTQIFQAANVTDAQKDKLKPVLDEIGDANNADRAKSAELMSQLVAAMKAQDPNQAAIQAQLKEQSAEIQHAMSDRRDKLMAALPDVLSAEQMKAAQDQYERLSADPAIRDRPVAREWVKTVAPGATLSEQQQSELVDKLVAVQQQFAPDIEKVDKARDEAFMRADRQDPDAKDKIMAEWRPQNDAVRAARAKAMNEAVDAVLTPEQRQQAAGARQDVWKKSVGDWQEATLKSFAPAQLTDDQLAKAKALADAAGQAMLKTDLYDADARRKISSKLREDIKALLTPEQQLKAP